MTWKSDLRAHDGRLSERVLTQSPAEAEVHFRRLLAREDLIGQPIAARIVSTITRNAIYFSRFDRDLGDGRIHQDAPLNLLRGDDGTAEATLWRPTEINWGAPFPDVMRQWSDAKGLTRDEAADLLKIKRETWRAWLYGKSQCSLEEPLKMLMKML